MRRVVVVALKAISLLSAVAILTWSAVPGPAEANLVICHSSGHQCHVEEDGEMYHYELYVYDVE